MLPSFETHGNLITDSEDPGLCARLVEGLRLEVPWEPSEESTRQTLRIELGESARRRQLVSFLVRTSHAEQPEVRIPIHILGQPLLKRE